MSPSPGSPSSRLQDGFTLLEVLIAATLSVALMVLLVQLFATGSRQASQTIARSAIERQARPALHWLEEDLGLRVPGSHLLVDRLGEEDGELVLLINDRRPGQVGETVLVRWYTAVTGNDDRPARGHQAMRCLYRQRLPPETTQELLGTQGDPLAFSLPVDFEPDPEMDALVAERVGALRLSAWNSNDNGHLEAVGHSSTRLGLQPALFEIELRILGPAEAAIQAAERGWSEPLDETIGRPLLLRFTP